MILKALQETSTSPELLELFQEAGQHQMSAEEINEQRISFVYGTIGNQHGISKDEVRNSMMRFNGRVTS
jgi:hypothetical protein